jgi:hypothetical protein
MHGAMVAAALEGRPVRPASMDSTEVEARERAARKPKKGRCQRGGDSAGGSPRGWSYRPGEPWRRTSPTCRCQRDHGCKRNSKEFMNMWKGYKLHMAVAVCGTTICAVLTSAFTHDSQAAVSLMQMGAVRAAVLYDLADSAYDAIDKRLQPLPGRRPDNRAVRAPRGHHPAAPAEKARHK